MAFRFNWPEFDEDFYVEARSQLEAALNKGTKPKNIVDHIYVTQLNMGTTAPELEILEISELSTDKFRGIFQLNYSGNASIVIQTKVQANPMHHAVSKESDLPRHTRPVLAADQPLIVPMLLRISELKLRGLVILVVSKTKGITLVFKNDPLISVRVSSTFDSVTSVRSFLQREIEGQLRNLFQEDLPMMIHHLSKRHLEKVTIQQQNPVAARSVIFSDPGRASTFSCSSEGDTTVSSMPDLTRYQSSIEEEDSSMPKANVLAFNALYASEFEEVIQDCWQEEEMTLPKQGSVAAQLAHLTTVHHTLSPFSHTIDHSTFRSVPHTIKQETRHKKTSKRRIIHWNSTI